MTELPIPPRQKRPYVRRAQPVRQEEVRAEPEIREQPVKGAKKVRQRKGGMNRPPLDLPTDVLAWATANSIDFMWATNSVAGMPMPRERMKFEINGWEAATGEMFDGRLAGLFHPKDYKGEITYDACVLLWRPMELTMESRAEEAQAARLPTKVVDAKFRGGQVDGISPEAQQHHRARAVTKVEKEMLPGLPVPSR